MSYADAAAKGPAQSDSDVSEILHEDSGVHSLDSLRSSNEHIQSLPSQTTSSFSSSSYAEQQLQAERANAAQREGKQSADELAREARQFVSHVEHEAGLLGGETTTSSSSTTETRSFGQATQARYNEVKSSVNKELHNFKHEASAESARAKKEAKKAEQWADKNKKNPVVVGNAVVITALAGVLGFGAYRLSKNESLTWRVVGVWAGAVGLFAVGDYFVSSWLFKKYPPKN